MTLESFTVGCAMVLYLITGTSFAFKGNWAWALTWWAYGLANIGLIWAAKK